LILDIRNVNVREPIIKTSVAYYKIHEAQVVALNPIYDTARQTSIPPMKYIADLGFVSARLMA
jgi:hypothetical protein